MSKPFLGIGWYFPLEVVDDDVIGNTGKLRTAEYEESVRQSIWLILGTAKGERVMRPDFGCGIYDLVFETNSASTAGRIEEEVKDALLFFEPRIDVLDVQVQPEGQGEMLVISIDYQVRATNNQFNLVYPFYLERGSA
ncbi:MAG TPA: GPW/gp25 family protein [Blastocatellia bacterium]|nr:GPW/gp25 family protein [Blastocatellia bacterium]